MDSNKSYEFISLTEQVQQLAIRSAAEKNPNPRIHFELLRLIDELRLAVETPEETVLRLIYQVG